MTNATVLANALGEAGILITHLDGLYQITYKGAYSFLPAEEVITDWRVAGKVLESMELTTIEQWDEGATWAIDCSGNTQYVTNESLPRAIIEAWYEVRR